VSRNAFYEFFADKADCFIAVCDQTGDEMLGELLELAGSRLGAGDARGGAPYLRWWQDRPTIASAYLIRWPTVGDRHCVSASVSSKAFRGDVADLARRARAEQPGLPRRQPGSRVLCGGLNELVPKRFAPVGRGG